MKYWLLKVTYEDLDPLQGENFLFFTKFGVSFCIESWDGQLEEVRVAMGLDRNREIYLKVGNIKRFNDLEIQKFEGDLCEWDFIKKHLI